MKTFSLLPAVLALALLFSACGQSDHFMAFEQIMDRQNKTIIDQQQAILDQQQKISDQEIRLGMMSQQLAENEMALKKLQDQLSTEASPKKPDSPVDARKMQVFRLLAGFNARLSANIGYGAYSDGLSDLNSNLTQGLIDVKDQSFIDQVNRIMCLYNYAGEFWQRFAGEGLTEINLSPGDRYRYANVGINFVDSYQPRQSDVKKFWLMAAQELDKLVDYNRPELGQSDTVRLYFAR